MGAISLQTSYSILPSTALIGAVKLGPSETTTMKNTNASVSIPIGSPVVFQPSSPTSDIDAASVVNSSDVLAGIVKHSDDYSVAFTAGGVTVGELDTTGLTVNSLMNVLVEGWIWVTCKNGCIPGNRLYVAYGSGSIYANAGEMGSVSDSSVIDATTKGEWMSTAAAGAGAWLKVDFSRK